jgi:membrane-bound lytic murein transglycosylase B
MFCCRSALALVMSGMLWAAAARVAPPAVAQGERAGVGADFQAFLEELWPDAQAKGIARAVFEQAFAGLAPDPRVIAATQRQPEYGKPVGAYINSVASPARIATGTKKAWQWSETFAAVEKRFAVERWVILGIWGIETSYGDEKDRFDVIRSLATLAQARFRHPYFRNELLVALAMLQEGVIARDKMLSSWAGAMGQPQFMPSNFYDFAVDFSGDGQRDIWTNIPDVLGSIANYLKKEGWNADLPWGFEVVVPPDYDGRRSRGSFQDWMARGVRRADAQVFPARGDAILFYPSGWAGPAFLVTENFVVIKRYNDSDVYALAVLHLADRLHGLGPIRTAWPADDRQLSRDQRIALQRKLAELGYPVRDFEGHFDFDLRDAIRDMQVKFGMRPDGHPTPALLDRLGIQ